MDIQPIVIGTAGHIDHGKSTLVQALTGIDPDRLEEEKERGMTIDLGFANFELPDGRRVGIVDVPGHERFIKNMVAGASGTDLVLLVVAADDGVMPQTREHLAILGLLGVEHGLIALTKIDMVSADLVELAALDVRETVEGTFLEDAPLLPVSAVTGEGMEELRAAIAAAATDTPERAADAIFRMPIQRVFSVRGFGTVVTGIPVSGEVRVGQVLEVVPGGPRGEGVRGKVRGLHAYHEATDVARAGHSTAINLTDVDHKDVHRGCVAATPGFFRPVRMVGARFTALADLGRPVLDRTPVRLHTGTAEAVGELVLLDCSELEPGGDALVQLRLEEPLVCAPGDRFVLRRASPLETLGGGVILEESRYRLKRFKRFVLDELGLQVESLESPGELCATALLRAGLAWRTSEELAREVKRSAAEVCELCALLATSGRVRDVGHDRWMHEERLAEGVDRLTQATDAWFDAHPHREVADVRDLRSTSGLAGDLSTLLIDEATRRGRLELLGAGKVRPVGRSVEADPETEALLKAVRSELSGGGFQPPDEDELVARTRGDAGAVRAVLELAIDRGEAARIGGGLVLAQEHVAAARAAITENCEANGALDIPSLRDRLGTTRKFLIPLLEYFDAQGLTLRQGGRRVLKRR